LERFKDGSREGLYLSLKNKGIYRGIFFPNGSEMLEAKV
jgi:hypothetical protein